MPGPDKKPKRISGTIYSLASLREDHERRTRYLTKADLEDIINSWGDVALVAACLDTTSKRIYEWIDKGTLRATIGPDGRWYIPLRQLRSIFDISGVPEREPIRSRIADPRALRRRREGRGEI